jgi:hypothetical protein
VVVSMGVGTAYVASSARHNQTDAGGPVLTFQRALLLMSALAPLVLARLQVSEVWVCKTRRQSPDVWTTTSE